MQYSASGIYMQPTIWHRMLYNKYAREKRGRRQQKNEYIIWSNGQQQADKMKNLSMPAFTIEMFFFVDWRRVTVQEQSASQI